LPAGGGGDGHTSVKYGRVEILHVHVELELARH